MTKKSKKDRVKRASVADPANKVIGGNIRRIRLLREKSQTKLADHLGVTFQQVQKYEKGTNRVSGVVMIKIAAFLECSVNDFYQGLTTGVPVENDPVLKLGDSRLGMRLATSFNRLKPASQQSVVDLCESLV